MAYNREKEEEALFSPVVTAVLLFPFKVDNVINALGRFSFVKYLGFCSSSSPLTSTI